MENDKVIFNVLAYIFLIVGSILCVIPFLLIVSASFTDNQAIFQEGYRLIPSKFSLEAYQVLFKSPMTIIRSYMVTITVTVFGTLLSLIVTSMAAYVLSRRDFRFRYSLSFFIYFTTLFSGGLIPFYILVVRYLYWKDSLLALIIPPLLSSWLIILMRNFMRSIPDAVIESAKVDGANDWVIYLRLVLPLSVPGLATIGLFTSLSFWNDWFHAMLFMEDRNLFPLQYFLYRMLNSMKFAELAMSESTSITPLIPMEALKMAMAVVATGPILFVYPFVQKYFVKGLMIGAVKG